MAVAVLSHIYTISTVFFTILLLELLVSFRAFFKFISLRSISTSIFISSSNANLFQLIEDELPSTLYNHNIPTSRSSECCSVCLSVFEEGEKIRKLKCKHIFHLECIDRWLEQDLSMVTCPLWRREILPKELVGRLRQVYSSLHEMENRQYDGSDDEELISLLSALQGTLSWRTLL